MPLGQLTDNGLNFSGKLRGFEVRFEIELRAIGVVPKTSRPYHPQTCGKVERFQQTLKKWLRRRPLAADLAELQAQLDAFVDYYNHHRPHRGIGNTTPAQRWARHPASDQPRHRPTQPSTRRSTALVAGNGLITVGRWRRQHRQAMGRQPRRRSRTTTPTSPCSTTTASSERSRSTQPAATKASPAARTNATDYPHLSGMSRDTPVRQVARHNIAR